MKCNKCNNYFDIKELKQVEESLFCKGCFSSLLDDVLSSKNMRKKLPINQKSELTRKSPRLGRVEFTFYMIVVWLFLPVLTQFIIFKFLNYPITHQLLSKDLILVLDSFQPLEVVRVGSGYSGIYNAMNLWMIQIPISINYAHGRLKDIGWNPVLSIVLGLPVINLLLCFWKGTKGENNYGLPSGEAALGKKIVVYGSPIIVPVALSIFGIILYG
ncbi:TPA: DUF805 domain-containing protein [Vibrio parahaemolyticus]|uniref:DUF805 domain-containing protein n=1 Tax=Vibrio vulnificus TaxID=672 RepID=UPI0019D494FB|nr:DUF805 domain-containing protein [Vibrio vulnificus]MBN8091002.1 DUF805 domain-containing protein [Vibrio vulnificus]MBN8119881.1 DUF805 domain-containing protein [Vibrio vulnificus]